MLKSILTDTRPPSMLVRVLVVLASLVFMRAGVTELVAPAGWDKSYGVPLNGADGFSFVQAVGARNIALSLIAIVGALVGNRGMIVLGLVAIAMIAAMDFYIVRAAGLTTAYFKHGIFAVLLSSAAIWSAISARTKPDRS